MSRRTRALLATLGLAAIGFAAVVGYAPHLLPPAARGAVTDAAEQMDPRLALAMVGVVVGIVGLFSTWLWRARSRSAGLADRDAAAADRAASVAGADVTSAFERRRREVAEPALDRGPVAAALRDVLIDVYARELDGRDAARRHVDEGRWTEDRYAAAAVSDGDAVDYPLTHRLYAWLYPGDAYEYRTRRALRAAEAACGERLTRYDPPERSRTWRDRARELLAARPGGDGE